jgi:hypothetical protein
MAFYPLPLLDLPKWPVNLRRLISEATVRDEKRDYICKSLIISPVFSLLTQDREDYTMLMPDPSNSSNSNNLVLT